VAVSSLGQRDEPSMEAAPEEVVIVPPPEIRAVVDKTAEYVAQVGPSFEAKVYAKEKNNPKFQFLMPQSHYHAYYRQQVERSKQGGGASGGDQEKKREPDEQQAAMQQEAKEAEAAAAAAAAEPQTTLEPPAVLSFVAELPESISAVALEVLSLAAQHVAVNGPPFHQALLNRERNSPLFAFLEASHAHHELYTQLVAQYEKVIELRKSAEETRKTLLAEDRATVLQRVLRRVEWERAEREKKAREVAAAKKGIAKADDDAIALQVDWDDFVVVQLIDLDDDPRYIFVVFCFAS
jgi:splicing factor 3A subunit 1